MIKNILKRILVNLLEKCINDVNNDSCELNEDELEEIINALSHRRLSKDQSCRCLNMSRSKFDLYVHEGKLPKGKKVVGFKELVWYLDELTIASEKIKRLEAIHKML